MNKRLRFFLLSLIVLIMTGKVLALPSEGLESFATLGDAKAYRLHLNSTVSDSYWRTEGASVGLETNLFTANKNVWSLGFTQTIPSDDKRAYFIRYDWTIWGDQSLSFKLAHEDLNYIESATENWGFEYSGQLAFPAAGSDFYYAIGIYQRWLKQSWDSDVHNPLSLNTSDKSTFLSYLMGVKKNFGASGNFLTFDVNNRDAFRYYNGDEMATDLGFYLNMNKKYFLKFFAGARWAAPFTYLPGYPAANYFGVSVIL